MDKIDEILENLSWLGTSDEEPDQYFEDYANSL